MPDSTEVLCQLRNESIIHLVTKAHEGLNKLDTIWLGTSPKSPQRMQLFNSHPGVPQSLM